MSKRTSKPLKEKRLPVFGVGPIYVITCLLLTILAVFLHYKGHLTQWQMSGGKILSIILGSLSILLAVWLWIQSVIVQNISKEIKQGKLVTTGVYGIVRNPIYSAFLFLFTGVLILLRNWLVLILPFVFWALLSLLMKCTEERWLKEKFGDEYIEYSKEVNRVIPWFRK